jgi:hypothetical protein
MQEIDNGSNSFVGNQAEYYYEYDRRAIPNFMPTNTFSLFIQISLLQV